MARHVKMSFYVTIEGPLPYLVEKAEDLKAAAVVGASSKTGKPLATVRAQRVEFVETDL